MFTLFPYGTFITEPGKSLSSYDTAVRALLAKMTLEEKLGQMAQAEQSALKDPSDTENYFLGSLLSGGSLSRLGYRALKGRESAMFCSAITGQPENFPARGCSR